MISHEIKSIVNQSFDDSHYIDDGRYDMMMIIIIINGESLERGGGETAIKSTRGRHTLLASLVHTSLNIILFFFFALFFSIIILPLYSHHQDIYCNRKKKIYIRILKGHPAF